MGQYNSMKMYIVYILRTEENTLYTGQTIDLEKRLEKHKSGKGSKYLRRFKKLELVHKEECKSLGEALRRETEIKRMTKSEKEKMILDTRF